MLDGRRRPEGRFFIGMLSVLLVWWGRWRERRTRRTAVLLRPRALAIRCSAQMAFRLLAWS